MLRRFEHGFLAMIRVNNDIMVCNIHRQSRPAVLNTGNQIYKPYNKLLGATCITIWSE